MGSRLILLAQCENAPDPDSRVSLVPERDPLGVRRVQLHWTVGELERRTLRQFATLVSRQLEQAGLATLSSNALETLRDDHTLGAAIRDGGHQMGTTRMHDSARLGVVDSKCRVHGIDNLYIASTAVFPTGGHSNPTLTMVALCVRIADTLKRRLRRDAVPAVPSPFRLA